MLNVLSYSKFYLWCTANYLLLLMEVSTSTHQTVFLWSNLFCTPHVWQRETLVFNYMRQLLIHFRVKKCFLRAKILISPDKDTSLPSTETFPTQATLHLFTVFTFTHRFIVIFLGQFRRNEVYPMWSANSLKIMPGRGFDYHPARDCPPSLAAQIPDAVDQWRFLIC